MGIFKNWMEQDEQESWKASKSEIMQHWNSLPPNIPFGQLRIIPKGHRGSTMPFDSIRVTGSSAWITSVLSRIKDLLDYESPQTKVNPIYKQQVDLKTGLPRPESYAFYAQVKQRGSTDKEKD